MQGLRRSHFPSPSLNDPDMLLFRLARNDLKLSDLACIFQGNREDLDVLQRLYFELPDVSVHKGSSYEHLGG